MTIQPTTFKAALCIALLLGASSCKKTDDGSGTTNPPAASIIGTWKITSIMSDRDVRAQVSGTMTRDIWAETQSCVKDNLSTFQSGGVLTQDEGATKCGASAPQVRTGSYTYQSSSLTMNNDTYTVLQLDNTTLKMSRTVKYYFISANQSLDSMDIVATVTEQRQ